MNTVKERAGQVTAIKDRVKNDKVQQHESERLTLTKVRSVLSPAVFERRKRRGLLAFFANLLVFSAVSTLLTMDLPMIAIIPLWIISGLTIGSMFVIGHDACHGALFDNQRLNYWVGQISMLPSLHAYGQWDFGHNRIHHGHTVKFSGDFVWEPTTVDEYKSYNRFQKIMHRIYWSRFGAGVYYMIEIWFKGMILYTANQKNALRDKLIVLAFMTASLIGLFTYGGSSPQGFSASSGFWMVFKVAVVPFIIWNYLMGFIVYVHHINAEINWKTSKKWSPVYGQLFSTVNYHVPRLLNLFFHNIMIHMPHHVHMRIPFYHLPLALEQIKAEFGEHVRERNTMFKDYLYSTRFCKLYDPENEEWRPYSAAL